MVLETQRIATYFAYQEALGTPLGFALGIPWYAPWAFFGWYETFSTYDAYGFMEQAVTQSQALFLVPQFLILGTWLNFLRKMKANANLRDSARWATEREIRIMGYRQLHQRIQCPTQTVWPEASPQKLVTGG